MKLQEINHYRSNYDSIEGMFEDYTPLYRHAEVNSVYRIIERKECVSLVGVGTVGKTHFLNHMRTNLVFNRYRHEQDSTLEEKQVIFVIVDPQALLIVGDRELNVESERAWSGFELLMSRLELACAEQQLDVNLQDLYGRVIKETETAHRFALRQFELALERILDHLSKNARLVLVFDEFERYLKVMPASFFINLRALRDQHRYQLLFMTISRSELYQLGADNVTVRKKMKRAEGWFELFKTPVYLRPAENGDLLELIRFLNARLRNGDRLTREKYNVLTGAVGGHGGLLRTALMLVDRTSISNTDTLITMLLDDSSVRRECEIMMESCTQEERDCLTTIAQYQPTEACVSVSTEFWNKHVFAIRTLYEKGLLNYQQAHLNDRTVENQLGVAPQVLRRFLQLMAWYQQNRQPFSHPANPREKDLELPLTQPPKPTILPEMP